jgi:hypothetical protein
MRLPINVEFDSRRTGRARGAIVARGIEPYDRTRHLARVLPVGPEEIADTSEPARRLIIRRLARALRAERNRGRAGHWTYDLNRHIALMQAFAAERAAARLAKTTDT